MGIRFNLYILMLVASVFTGAGVAKASVTPSTDECLKYTHLQATLTCPSPNYFTDFGFKYCRLFEERERDFSPSAQTTLPLIRACLVTLIVNDPSLSCDNAKERALDHHYECYTQNGFCTLPFHDKLRIYQLIHQELSDPEFRKTMQRIRKTCRALS